VTVVRSAESLEYVRVAVAATGDNGVTVDPTGDTVALALLDRFTYPSGTTTWLPAAWQTDTSDPANTIYYAALLVGPSGDYVPTSGARVSVWVKVSDNPEAPVTRGGDIQFV
jgi:hypothetical protein